ncbi:MAG: hypothetical protein IJ088_02910 [Clostridia bacterium]|nr:hypothetical protein [Clostridia bacterium]
MKKLFERRPAVLLVGAFLFAFLLAVGVPNEQGIPFSLPRTLLLCAALMVPLTAVLYYLFRLRLKGSGQAAKLPSGKWRVLILMGIYLPAFLILCPGTFAYDTPFQLKQFFTGQYSVHHPILHTLYVGSFIRLGKWIGQVNIGAILYTLTQILALSCCFVRCTQSIEKQCGSRTAFVAYLFFALYPLHMLMAGTATKDTLFSGLFALSLCLIYQKMRFGVHNRENGRMILAIVFSILLRNNAVYVYLVWSILGLILLRESNRKTALAVLMSTLLAMGIGAGLKSGFHAASGSVVEMLSVPIQQMARVRLMRPEALSEEEINRIDTLMPGEAWRNYDATISDPVKFEMDGEAIRADMSGFFRLYLSVLVKCPDLCMDAFLDLTHAFLFPYQTYRVSGAYLQTDITDDYYDDWWTGERIHDMSLFPRARQALWWRFGAKGAMQWPIGYLFNMGVLVWLCLFLSLRRMYLDEKGSAFVALLPLLLLGTYLLGPCMTARYVYPFVCILPVLAGGVKRKENEQ